MASFSRTHCNIISAQSIQRRLDYGTAMLHYQTMTTKILNRYFNFDSINCWPFSTSSINWKKHSIEFLSEWINFEWKNSKCVTESPTWRLKWNVFIQFQPQEEHNFIKNWYSFKFTAWRPIKWKGECDRFNYVLIGNEDPSWTFYLLLLNFQKHEFLSFTKYFGCLFSSWPKKNVERK